MIFVRHGETDWNVKKQIQGCTDIDLNDKGFSQAKLLADKIGKADYQLSCIYSSRLKRALKTAETISNEIHIPVVAFEGLEEMNLGVWEGRTWADIPSLYPEEYQTWHQERRYTRTPGGESYQDLLDRLLPALKQIIQREEKNGDVLIVTHSAVIMTLQSYLHQTPFYEMSKRYRVGNAEMVVIESDRILQGEETES